MRKTKLTNVTRSWFRGRIGDRSCVSKKIERRRLLLEKLEVRSLMAADLLLMSSEVQSPISDMEQPVEIRVSNELMEPWVGDVVDSGVRQDTLLTMGPTFDPIDLGQMESPEFEINLSDDSADAAYSGGVDQVRVVGSFVYYDDSIFAESGVSAAIDPTQQLVVETSVPQTLTLSNVINTTTGITGLVFDVENLAATELTTNDFYFQVSPQGSYDPSEFPATSWEVGPDPESIEVVGSEELTDDDPLTSRVVVRWADNAIEDRWLRITLLANENTGLAEPIVYYIGHLRGKTDAPTSPEDLSSIQGFFEVANTDLKAVREQVGMNVGVDNIFDVNKDGVVSYADVRDVASARDTRLTVITVQSQLASIDALTDDLSLDVGKGTPVGDDNLTSGDEIPKPEVIDVFVDPVPVDLTATADPSSNDPVDQQPDPQIEEGLPLVDDLLSPDIVGAYVYHSDWASVDSNPNSAVDTVKQLALETSTSATLGINNVIDSKSGINGLVFDVLNATWAENELTASSFVFQMSPTGAFNELKVTPDSWELAPQPSGLTIDYDAETDISRVTLEWPDEAIMNRWLRVTVLADEATGLREPEVYYVGHLLGKNTDWMINYGQWNPSGIFEVHTVDLEAIRDEVGSVANAGNPYDINKDGFVNFADITASRDAVGQRLSNITIVSIPAALQISAPVLPVGSWHEAIAAETDSSTSESEDVKVVELAEDTEGVDVDAIDEEIIQTLADSTEFSEEEPSLLDVFQSPVLIVGVFKVIPIDPVKWEAMETLDVAKSPFDIQSNLGNEVSVEDQVAVLAADQAVRSRPIHSFDAEKYRAAAILKRANWSPLIARRDA